MSVDADAWVRRCGQAWIDRRLAESTAARDAIARLEGRCFALRLAGPDLEIVLAVTGGRLEWLPPGTRVADATLVATPFDALALARSRSLARLRQTDARLEGNIGIAEQFAAACGFLTPDPEAELAGWIGDIAAHDIATTVRTMLGFARRAATSLEQDTAEFLREEQPMLARRFEIDEFIESVDDLRDAVDRLEARVARLDTRRRRPSRSAG